MKRDLPIIGFLIGVFAPFIGLVIMYFLWGNHQGFTEFVRSLFKLRDMAAKVFTLSLLINLIPFVFFTSRRRDYTARGIFIATMIYVLLIVLVKYVW